MLKNIGKKADSNGLIFKMFVFWVSIWSACVSADVEINEVTPAIPGYGKIHAVNERKSPYAVSTKSISKFIFQITKAAPSPEAIHPELEKVARAINLMVADGVPIDHMNIVVLIGGSAVDVATNSTHYRTAFGIENPSKDLLSKLHKVGVSIVVSDQALASKNLNSSALVDYASTALSSFTAITSLVQAGYSIASL